MKANWKYILVVALLMLMAASFGYAGTTLLAGPKHVLSGSMASLGDKQFRENGDYYTVTATYPSKTPLWKWYDRRTDARAIEAIEQSLADTIKTFKQSGNFEALSVEEKKALELADSRKYTLDISYKPYTSPGYVSYVFLIYMDTGGAHPNGFYHTITFDKQGDSVPLSGLFKDNVSYLDRISAVTYSQVLAQLKDKVGGELRPEDEDAVRLGTEPSPETLQFFYLDNENLLILIPPYQAAAYAAGSFEAKIPLDSLKDILK